MTEKERYLQNKSRVFEIYGISTKDRRYDCHHIIGRAECSELMGEDFDVHQVSNLVPMRLEDHHELHRRLDLIEYEYQEEQKQLREMKYRKPKRTFDCGYSF